MGKCWSFRGLDNIEYSIFRVYLVVQKNHQMGEFNLDEAVSYFLQY